MFHLRLRYAQAGCSSGPRVPAHPSQPSPSQCVCVCVCLHQGAARLPGAIIPTSSCLAALVLSLVFDLSSLPLPWCVGAVRVCVCMCLFGFGSTVNVGEDRLPQLYLLYHSPLPLDPASASLLTQTRFSVLPLVWLPTRGFFAPLTLLRSSLHSASPTAIHLTSPLTFSPMPPSLVPCCHSYLVLTS